MGTVAKPNVVMITTDHQRSDTLFMRQDGMEVTPHLNRLAADSCVFSRAYCSTPLCVPARTALATGKYPARTGVLVNDWSGETASDHRSMHEYLGEAGYRLGHFGVQHIRLRPELRARARFDAYMDLADYKRIAGERGAEAASSPSPESKREVMEMRNGAYERRSYSSALPSVWSGPLEKHQDVFFTRQAEAFLRKSASEERPFALFLNIWAPHPPLAVPEPYASRFRPSAIELPSNIGVPAAGEPRNRRLGVPAQLAEGITEEQWRRTWAAHLGLTQLADACVGRIIRTLQEIGAYENTIILFMSDHGDHLGQHAMYQKMEMYEQAVRVPMLIKTPGARLRWYDGVMSHLDVLPTLLDLLGLKAADQLDGLSLASALGGGPAPDDDRAVFSQYSGNAGIGDIRRAVITKRYKYIYDPHADDELYDLQEDLLEMNNLAGEPRLAAVRARLRGALFRWARDCGDELLGDEA